MRTFKRFLLVGALFSVFFSCGACVATATRRPGIPVSLLEARDRHAGRFYCEPDEDTGGLLCTDYERFKAWEAGRSPAAEPQSL